MTHDDGQEDSERESGDVTYERLIIMFERVNTGISELLRWISEPRRHDTRMIRFEVALYLLLPERCNLPQNAIQPSKRVSRQAINATIKSFRKRFDFFDPRFNRHATTEEEREKNRRWGDKRKTLKFKRGCIHPPTHPR